MHHPHIVCQNPHDTAAPMFPCGKCINSSVTMCFSTSLQNLYATSFRSLPCTETQNFLALFHCSHFGPCIHYVKFVVILQPHSHIFSCLSFGYQTGMQVFYVTPALGFGFIVVSSVFHLLAFLDRSSPIPTMPTKFHHHFQASIHSTPVTPGSRHLPLHFGRTTHCGFHPKHPSSFIRITIG